MFITTLVKSKLGESGSILFNRLFVSTKTSYFFCNSDEFSIAVLCILFGLGLGFGMILQDATTKEYWIPFSLFVGTGIGFVLTNVLTDKMKKKNN
ncbi:MAG TPA: hypothetical protein PKE38_08035 [Ignavibacteriaceae bacterium]|nr:hypothetical protein [Ignavibacteriaceae bacterium]